MSAQGAVCRTCGRLGDHNSHAPVPVTAFSPAESARLAEFDAAPDAPESLRERVAVAIHDADDMGGGTLVRWENEITVNRNEYRNLADAAIAVLRGEQ